MAKNTKKAGFFKKIKIKFGEMAKSLGFVSDSELKKALKKQEADPMNKRIGEILVQEEKITMDHVDKVLKSQDMWPTNPEEGSDNAPGQQRAAGTAKKSARKKPASAGKTTKKKPLKKSVKKTGKKKTTGTAAKKTTKKKAAAPKKSASTNAKKTTRKKPAKKASKTVRDR